MFFGAHQFLLRIQFIKSKQGDSDEGVVQSSLNHFFSQVSEIASQQPPKSDIAFLNRPKNSSLNGSTLL